ncbi:hypothetical protein AGLY_009540 [Aphis glycines]|uniref:Uncharacterized protein n=1 Tax=Aphis glycines TaxID=307491 RepID=A0A6G0THW6_APHGL|nr:hypothetical protein AGLY_009540 [Aphis glycines]
MELMESKNSKLFSKKYNKKYAYTTAPKLGMQTQLTVSIINHNNLMFGKQNSTHKPINTPKMIADESYKCETIQQLQRSLWPFNSVILISMSSYLAFNTSMNQEYVRSVVSSYLYIHKVLIDHIYVIHKTLFQSLGSGKFFTVDFISCVLSVQYYSECHLYFIHQTVIIPFTKYLTHCNPIN